MIDKKIKRKSNTCLKRLAIDAFCGAGGLSLGLIKAGFGICLAYDMDEKAVETYRKNIGNHVLLADARRINILKTLAERSISPEDIILFAGGPPCQGFSVQRRGEGADSRNGLVKIFFEQALSVRPNFILMENVLGIAGPRGKEVLEHVKRTCGSDYWVYVARLNAADFGAPQLRKRFFIVAERFGNESPLYAFPKPIFAPASYKTVRDVIGDLPSPPADGSEHFQIPNHRCDVLSEINRKRFECVPPSGGRDDIPNNLRLPCHRITTKKAGHRYVYGRLDWDKPSSVVTARFDSLTRGRFGHPVETRTISLREGARLQTFPDDFIFVGNKVQVARQIGNAVPPVLAEALGKSIMDAWKRGQNARLKESHGQ